MDTLMNNAHRIYIILYHYEGNKENKYDEQMREFHKQIAMRYIHRWFFVVLLKISEIGESRGIRGALESLSEGEFFQKE